MEHGYHLDPIQQKNTESVKPRSKPAELAQKFLTRITEAQEFASAAMAAAQMCMEEKAKKKREETENDKGNCPARLLDFEAKFLLF